MVLQIESFREAPLYRCFLDCSSSDSAFNFKRALRFSKVYTNKSRKGIHSYITMVQIDYRWKVQEKEGSGDPSSQLKNDATAIAQLWTNTRC